MTIPEESKTGRKAVLFYENWWLMAESRDTGPKRLAFYDAIMRFAFLGEVPKTPEKGVSAGEEWAAHDGYLVCKPILDGTVEREKYVEAGRLGGLASKGIPKSANRKRTANEQQTEQRNNSTSNSTLNSDEQQAEQRTEQRNQPPFNKDKENTNANTKDSIGGTPPCESSLSNDEAALFDAWWKAYPGPRKQDKRKCAEKFARILRKSGDAVSLFNRIMGGLEKWKRCETWTRDGGRFVCAPLVWLNNERWEAEIRVGPLSGGIDNIHREEVEVTNAF